MIPLSVPEIEGGYPERYGGEEGEEEEGLVLEYSSSWIGSVTSTQGKVKNPQLPAREMKRKNNFAPFSSVGEFSTLVETDPDQKPI